MPGYVIHMAEASQIIDEISRIKGTPPDYEQTQQFLVGNLLPDTRLRSEKQYSHFWNEEELADIARSPDLKLFLDKYGDRLSDPVYLGYYSHLYLDSRYVECYWPREMKFFDSSGHEQKLRRNVSYVQILRTGEKVPLDRFFSSEYYYGEYSRLNSYYVKRYHLTVPDVKTVRNFQMDEVKLEDMDRICSNLHRLIDRSEWDSRGRLRVFDKDSLEAFIHETAMNFVSLCRKYHGGVCQ